MKKRKKTILVTGGAGFIGSQVAKRLMDLGYKAVIVDNFNSYYDPRLKRDRISLLLKGYHFKLYKADICSFEKLKKVFKENKIDIICHLAAQAGVRYSLENPFVYGETNIKGTLNLLELAKDFKVKGFVFASSSSVYGNNKKIPFLEKDLTENQISLYGATKKMGEILVKNYSLMYKIPATILRYFSVYGPFWRPDLALCKFAKAISKNKPIDVYNFGRMWRDFTFIDDIVEGTVLAIKKNYSFEIFNLGRGKPVRLADFIKLIEKELGKKAKKILMPLQKGDVPKTWADISKAKRKLGYRPKVEIEQGVKRTIDWYKKYNRINKT